MTEILSTGLVIDDSPEFQIGRVPTEKHIRVVTAAEADQLFNPRKALLIGGNTVRLAIDSDRIDADTKRSS